MKDSVRHAVMLGGVGALCGGCVSLLYIGFSAASAALGLWFWGLVGLIPAAGLLGAAAYFRTRRDAEACEVEPGQAAE